MPLVVISKKSQFDACLLESGFELIVDCAKSLERCSPFDCCEAKAEIETF